MYNQDFTFLCKTRTICGVTYIYAKVQGFYGWYKLEPVELPEEENVFRH